MTTRRSRRSRTHSYHAIVDLRNRLQAAAPNLCVTTTEWDDFNLYVRWRDGSDALYPFWTCGVYCLGGRWPRFQLSTDPPHTPLADWQVVRHFQRLSVLVAMETAQ